MNHRASRSRDGAADELTSPAGRPQPEALASRRGPAVPGGSPAGANLHFHDGVAESMFAAAVTIGSDIHFADAAVHPTLGPEPGLLRHELMHVEQQRLGAEGEPALASEDELEAQAAEAVDGESSAPVLASVRRPLRTTYAEWFAANFPWTESRANAVAAQASRDHDREGDLMRQPATYHGTDTPVAGSDPTAGRVVAGSTFDNRADGFQHDGRGDFMRRDGSQIVLPSADPAAVDGTTTITNQTTDTISVSGRSATRVDQHGTETQTLDLPAMTRDARTALRTQRDDHQRELETAQRDLAQLDQRLAREHHALGDAERRARIEADPRRQELHREARRLATDVAQTDRNLTTLDGTVDQAQLAHITAAHRLVVAPRYRTVDADTATTTTALSASGGSRTRRAQEIHSGADGRRVSDTGTSRTAVDLTAGTASRSQNDVHEDTDPTGAGSRSSTGRSHTVGLGDGRLGYTQQRTRNDEQLGPDGAVTSGRSSSRSGGVSLQAPGENETGFGGNYGGDRATRTGNTERRVKASVDGSFTVEISSVDGSSPPQFQVIMRVRINGSLGGSTGTAARGADEAERDGHTGSVGVGVNAGAALTYTHVMTVPELRAYLGGADTADAGGAGGSQPEFGLLSRMRALRNAGDAARDSAAVMGSADASRALGDGESVELTLSGGVSGNASAGTRQNDGAQTASASIQGSALWERTIRVQRTGLADAHGRHMVDVTVGFRRTLAHEEQASGSAMGVDASARHQATSTSGESVMIRLDADAADYDSRYHRIAGTLDPASLRTLATEYTRETSDSTTNGGSLGTSGVSLGQSVTESGSDRLAVNRDDHTVGGTFVGGRSDEVNVSVGGTRVLRDISSGEASTTVDQNGMETTISATQQTTNLGDNLSHARANALPTDLAAATTSQQDRLRRELERTRSELDQYRLTEAGINTVAARAGEGEAAWNNALVSLRVIGPWGTLRSALVHPEIDAELARIDPAGARRVALGRAFATFMRATGDLGHDCIERVLRYWHYDGMNSAQDVGLHLQWPPSLASARTDYDTANSRVRGISQQMAGYVGRPDGLARAEAWVLDTHRLLDGVQRRIEASSDGASPRARMEMVESVQTLGRQLDAGFNTSRAQLVAPVATPADTTANSCELPPPDQQRCAGPIMSVSDGSEPLHHEIADKIHLLTQYHAQEAALFARARGALPSDRGGTMTGWFQGMRSDFFEAHERMRELGEMQEAWIAVIVQLRRLYGQVHTPADQWRVSAAAGQPRRRDTEPDVETQIRLYLTDEDTMRDSMSRPVRQHQAERWRERVQGY